MAALVKALDNTTPLQHGENGHIENGWSKSIQEKIVQFQFQCTRTNGGTINNLQTILNELLMTLKSNIQITSALEKQETKLHLATLYKIVGQTRDIIDGKGEYALAYMMIYAWYQHFPVLGKFALYNFVTPMVFEVNNVEEREREREREGEREEKESKPKNTHPYGSWKDIKYFCVYCKNQGLSVQHDLMEYAFTLMNDQLRTDLTNGHHESLASKWAPREKSTRFGWIFTELAIRYFPEYIASAKTSEKRAFAVKKCQTLYRKLISSINKKLGTTQIFQTAGNWAAIDMNNVTSITMSKQKKAFLNVKKDSTTVSSELPDRITCGEHMREYLEKAKRGEVTIKGKRVSMANFTAQALNLIQQRGYSRPQDKRNYHIVGEAVQAQIDLLNAQWRDSSSLTESLDSIIPMCDCSGSMSGDPMNVAIALSIRAAEKSKLGKRVLAFSACPTWTDLTPYDNFVDMVSVLMHEGQGMNTNFHLALKMILNVIEEKKLTPEDVDGLILAVFSDMQIDGQTGYKNEGLDMHSSIVQQFHDVGMRLWGKPFTAPHILFWNLRSTGGSPALSSVKNASMMSGFSPALLNLFTEKGMSAFESASPWGILLESLNNERYACLGAALHREIV